MYAHVLDDNGSFFRTVVPFSLQAVPEYQVDMEQHQHGLDEQQLGAETVPLAQTQHAITSQVGFEMC